MKERPILFSTEMVRAILDGRKTMTRRVVKFPSVPEWHDWDYDPYEIVERWPYRHYQSKDKENNSALKSPYGQIGDVLWVRETYEIYQGKYKEHHGMVIYKASEKVSIEDGNKFGEKPKWKPSIFMPRSASRISLRITNIRVERLNDITPNDCVQEGTPDIHKNWDSGDVKIAKFIDLWESINGKDSWEQNPWVWVIEFEVETCPQEIQRKG